MRDGKLDVQEDFLVLEGFHELRDVIGQRQALRRETYMPSGQPDIERVDDRGRTGAKAIEGKFRKACVSTPRAIEMAPGLSIFGRKVKSLVFSTDLAIISNCDSDAVFAVYPFTCQPTITAALVKASGRPVFTGVAGTTTYGIRSAALAVASEIQGAYGVVMNSPSVPADISLVASAIDIPLVLTIVRYDEQIEEKIGAGAAIVNVAAGGNTPQVVSALRAAHENMPIIASGGKTDESILATIAAGADAITWVPPTIQELQRVLMDTNRAVPVV